MSADFIEQSLSICVPTQLDHIEKCIDRLSKRHIQSVLQLFYVGHPARTTLLILAVEYRYLKCAKCIQLAAGRPRRSSLEAGLGGNSAKRVYSIHHFLSGSV